MGNGVSRIVGCFVPGGHDRERVAVLFSEPLDEGLGHSFCYVRPALENSPQVSPSHSDRYSVVPVPWTDSETRGGSFRLSSSDNNAAEGLKNLSETTFKSISGASVSANTSTPHTIVCHEQFHSFTNVPTDRAAAFESTASFSSLPLQPVPRGAPFSGPISNSFSGPIAGSLERGFMSGPIERGLMSGPLEKGFMSGPLERGYMSGPLESSGDRSHFSAPLAGFYSAYYRRRQTAVSRLLRTVSKPVKGIFARTLYKTSSTLARTQRSLVTPVKKFMLGHFRDGGRETTAIYDNPSELGYSSSDIDSKESRNLQWAQGKAGEDRVHVVLSEEHGWLFVGIYDGFNGPDAPDFLMRNLYRAIYKELQGLLWDNKDDVDQSNSIDENDSLAMNSSLENDETDTGVEGQATKADSGQSESCSSSPAKDDELESLDHSKCTQGGNRIGAGTADPSGEKLCAEVLQPLVDRDRRENTDACPSSIETHNFEPERILCDQNTDVKITETKVDSGAPCSISDDKTGLDATCESGTGDVRTHAPGTAGMDLQKGLSDTKQGSSRPARNFRRWRGRSFFKPKIRHRDCSGSKESHRKLIPWRYDWEHERRESKKSRVELHTTPGEFKQYRPGAVDHSAVLKALASALEATEKAYLEMADRALDENPELALMGSCILVMLMKDEDVYVMNVGDSRAIVAQQRSYEHHALSGSRSQSLYSHIAGTAERIGARDSLMQLDLERIIEETPTELETFDASYSTCQGEHLTASLLLNALQLSTDHSTSIEEEILRIKAEHPDDNLSILNDRVKGRLKVTRAFGAGFLKEPRWNSAILEMFRIDFVGSAPYISCTPALQHHRLGPDDRFLILSSDGLYQYLSNQEVVHLVQRFMEKFPDGDPAQHLIEELLFRAAKKAGMDFHELLDIPQGDRRKYHDDVSVMVISLEGRIWKSSH